MSGETGLAGPARAAWAGGRKERGEEADRCAEKKKEKKENRPAGLTWADWVDSGWFLVFYFLGFPIPFIFETNSNLIEFK